MKIVSLQKGLVFLLVGLNTLACKAPSTYDVSLSDAFEGKFYIGTALSEKQLLNDSPDLNVVKKNFNAIVAENCMKSEEIQPLEGIFDFAAADKFVEFGKQNNMFITGHTLIWHSQAPDWFFTDSLGNDVSREVMIDRMRKHIHTVVSRYKGIIKGWDVVNEAILDDGTYRNSKFFQIIGEDFIKLAFQFAHEADPDAELYYNDYSMAESGKRKGVVNMVKNLQLQGIRIDGIGMQSHIGLDFPKVREFEASIKAFESLGVKVMITELDLTVIPSPDWNAGAEVSTRFEYKDQLNPYKEELPDSVRLAFENRYMEFFQLFLKYQQCISRVTLWGVNDNQTWRNNWPIPGRTDYPLLFDRKNQAKPVVNKLIELAKEN